MYLFTEISPSTNKRKQINSKYTAYYNKGGGEGGREQGQDSI